MLPSNLGLSARPSVQPFSGTWQVSQDICFVLESRLSKKSCSPSAIFPGVILLSAGTSIGWSWMPLGSVKSGACARAVPPANSRAAPDRTPHATYPPRFIPRLLRPIGGIVSPHGPQRQPGAALAPDGDEARRVDLHEARH